MSSVPSRRVLPLVAVVVALVAGRAESAIDVTGTWYLAFDSTQGPLDLVQAGGTLHAGGSWVYNQGTIDSATGVFTLNLAIVDGLPSCATFTGTVDAASRTLTGTARLYTTTFTPGCTALNLFCVCNTEADHPLWGSRAPCGNGVLDPGETCDDGHVAPGDCCGLGCTLDPAGTACADDGNVCTDEACDGAGTCLHTDNTAPCGDPVCAPGGVCSGGVCQPGTPAPAGTACDRDANGCTVDACDGLGACSAGGAFDCGPCATCTPPGGCGPNVRSYCIGGITGLGHRSLDLRTGSTAARERAAFAWADGIVTYPADFGDPTQGTDYELCLFQPATLSTPVTPVGALRIPAGGTCGGRPCWSAVPSGFRFRNPSAKRTGGATFVKLHASQTELTSLVVRGAGAPLGLPASLDLPDVRAQLVATYAGADVRCWEWESGPPMRHTATRFTARR